ncbi:uncharacterized protein LOC112904449 [Agrilus planipennis]|uniref:Uncharacterized protein LOC108733483 isoform X3 n=1 Tax=Agrilus planipennis TaxID=224129 RepID=A0A1W4WJH3_AGRPL|nr:uncharacterized protein LOC108733483 isoform X3 [Agrilus planipennis]XP_025830320.1 uncharacterized protein LOC112904449 [Agrilus planipennis]
MPKGLSMVAADQLWKAYVVSEDNSKDAWTNKWNWILEEYEKLHQKLDEISKTADYPKPPPDVRSLKPFPNSVNHEYGWVCANPEFRLEKYGPDIMKPMPLPKDN